MKELPKTYDPAASEDGIYAKWEKANAFRPQSDDNPKLKKQLKPYTIILPPPNVTGILHAGHALMITLQDILIRQRRMRGFDTLWLPGTDHAAIATENKVVEKLSKEGKTKEKLGRAAFLKEAKQFAAEHKHIIEDQIKAMGASVDWSRNAFTMDAPREAAVKSAFHRLYKNGLIYRGDYMVNWCPVCQTVLSDDEVEHQEQEGVLYYMKYGPFRLATTRPETKVGDTAVAVNPQDQRYTKWVGKEIDVEMINGVKKLTVVADEAVDPEFGTGVVKVTPFHDRTDYQIGQRHDLSALEVIAEDGTMTKAAGKALAGRDRFEARKKMVDWLQKRGLLEKEEVIRHSVGRCYRSGDVIEPRISKQWFLSVQDIKQQAIAFLNNGDLQFAPKRFEKIYRDWLEKMHDWCISRQVWFGHPVPAYLNKEGEVSLTKKAGYAASTDTLDTWFSSALWPFSTMGWPKASADLKRFFPNDVLETGYEIIFFWIARMVLMTVALDVKGADGQLKPPFHTVYLNGIVRDERGRKFSKSLGNGVDPLEMNGKYGTDAFRFTLATLNAPGADIKFDEQRIVGSRNFANKLWNIARFIIAQEYPWESSRAERNGVEEPGSKPKQDSSAPRLGRSGRNDSDVLSKLRSETLTTFDRAILHKLRQTWLECERVFYDETDYEKPQPHPEKPNTPNRPRPYDLAYAGNELYSFLWSDFADWYVEAAKVQLKDPDTHQNTNIILSYVLETVLALLHPFMPFITETLWTDGLGKKQLLAQSKWPQLHEDLDQPEDAERFERLKSIVETIRRMRKDHRVPPAAWPQVLLVTDETRWLVENADVINRLAHLKMLRIRDNSLTKRERSDALVTVSGGTTIALFKSGLVDEAAEEARLQGSIEATKMEVERLQQRLANKHYAKKAPKHVVSETKAALAEAEAKLKKLEENE